MNKRLKIRKTKNFRKILPTKEKNSINEVNFVFAKLPKYVIIKNDGALF